jgi:tetratricopeptide (TPR) repeat protein
MKARVAIVVWALLAACSAPADQPLPPGAQARSLLGDTLYPPPVAEGKREEMEQQLREARARWLAAPDDADALIWYGRRLAYLGRFVEAVELFTEGIQRHPDDARMWRWRGHRFITLRQFERAVADLTRASQLIAGRPDEVEPSGMPNARGIDLDTLHENVWYHLALARFLLGDFEGALADWERCRGTVRNDDGRAMCAYWIASAAGRAASIAQAKGVPDRATALLAQGTAALRDIRPDMDIVEYHGYHRLALAWAGLLQPDELVRELRAQDQDAVDFATVAFGVAHWHLCRGETEDAEVARRLFEEISRGESWHAFGHIAAEVELARMRGGR